MLYDAKTPLTKVLRALSLMLPGDRARTFVYLHLIQAPRRLLRRLPTAFYRYDFVYDVLRQVRRDYVGEFSIIEFGTGTGYTFVKLLYATRYLGLQDRVTVHGFDSFEGTPPAQGAHDLNLVDGNSWKEGQFAASAESIREQAERIGTNFELHPGLFSESATPEVMERIARRLPVIVFVDCDYYSSTRDALLPLLPFLPNGCVLYFDDVDLNYRSRRTGEMRFVSEVNEGKWGPEMELIPDVELSGSSQRIYRFFRIDNPHLYERVLGTGHRVRPISNASPLP